MDIDYKGYSTNCNWYMHQNPYSMPEEDRKQFYEDVKTMPFNEMAMKNLEVIRQIRKQKKLETKQIKYE